MKNETNLSRNCCSSACLLFYCINNCCCYSVFLLKEVLFPWIEWRLEVKLSPEREQTNKPSWIVKRNVYLISSWCAQMHSSKHMHSTYNFIVLDSFPIRTRVLHIYFLEWSAFWSKGGASVLPHCLPCLPTEWQLNYFWKLLVLTVHN